MPPSRPLVVDRFAAATAELAVKSGFQSLVVAIRDAQGETHLFSTKDGLTDLRDFLVEKLGIDDSFDTAWPA
jgi:hypothetical protein